MCKSIRSFCFFLSFVPKLFAFSFPFVFCCPAIVSATDVTLAWDINPEPELAGYKIYYGTTSGHSYKGDDANEGKSGKIVVKKDTTTITLTGLSDHETYYFAVTAYNIEGLESAYSNEVSCAAVKSPDPVEMVIEAEEMSYHANGTQKGSYWLLWSNGTMDEHVYFQDAGTYRFEITAKADLALGTGPEMELLIDGVNKGSFFVNTKRPKVFVFNVEVSPGVREFAIGFYNDFCDPSRGIDRNLYVDKSIISHRAQ